MLEVLYLSSMCPLLVWKMRILVLMGNAVLLKFGFAGELPTFNKDFKTTYPVVEDLFRSFDEKYHFFGTSSAGLIGQYWAGELRTLLDTVNVLPVSRESSPYSSLQGSLKSAFTDFDKVHSSSDVMAKSRIKFRMLVVAITALEVVRDRSGELIVWDIDGKANGQGHALRLIHKLLEMSRLPQNNGISLWNDLYDFQWTQKVSTFFNTDKGYQSVPVPGFSTTMIMLRALIEVHDNDENNKDTQSLKTLFDEIARNTEALSDGRMKLYENTVFRRTASIASRFVSYSLTTLGNLWVKLRTKKSSAEDQVAVTAGDGSGNEEGSNNQKNGPAPKKFVEDAMQSFQSLQKAIPNGITAAAARNIVCRFRATPLETVAKNIDKIIKWIAEGARQKEGEGVNSVGLEECESETRRYVTEKDIVGKVEIAVAKAKAAADALKQAERGILLGALGAKVGLSASGRTIKGEMAKKFGFKEFTGKVEIDLKDAIKNARDALVKNGGGSEDEAKTAVQKADEADKKADKAVVEAGKALTEAGKAQDVQILKDLYALVTRHAIKFGGPIGEIAKLVLGPGVGLAGLLGKLKVAASVQKAIKGMMYSFSLRGNAKQVLEEFKEVFPDNENQTPKANKEALETWLKASEEKSKINKSNPFRNLLEAIIKAYLDELKQKPFTGVGVPDIDQTPPLEGGPVLDSEGHSSPAGIVNSAASKLINTVAIRGTETKRAAEGAPPGDQQGIRDIEKID